ncbi:hypothetical protein [Streptomyces sp. NPDC000618]|uniref:hypothetical protein n=1 Tax=Streptomyces sp. NPDC000618 TaxID=3154265 RepID=UPI003331EB57
MAREEERVVPARRLPKAELHMHQVGSLAPSELARLHRRTTGAGLSRAVRLWGDEALVTEGVLRMIAGAYDRGVRNLELLCTPDLHRDEIGMEPEVLLRAVGEAFRYGNDGDHHSVPFEALAPACERARGEGYRLTGHADMIEDVAAALDLGLDRIDHGWMGVDDPEVLRRLRATRTPMTFTPTAYALGGLVSRTRYVDAWRVLDDSGVPMLIGTDDPELFHTDLAQDNALLANALRWSDEQLGAAAKRSLAHAWFFDSDGADVRAHRFAEIDALVADPRSPRRERPAESLALVTSVGLVATMVAQPLIGVFSDRTRTRTRHPARPQTLISRPFLDPPIHRSIDPL